MGLALVWGIRILCLDSILLGGWGGVGKTRSLVDIRSPKNLFGRSEFFSKQVADVASDVSVLNSVSRCASCWVIRV
jgi:hypothetical protein